MPTAKWPSTITGDLEMFPVIRRIIERTTNEPSVYKSPTDMGVNRIGFGIVDDDVVQEASRQEIIRRYFKTSCEYKKGLINEDAMQRHVSHYGKYGIKTGGTQCCSSGPVNWLTNIKVF